ncbi:hypothetical protein Bbelb_291440 [Branchiostoma belcheri]|nr:hypothetical protein Bbelb_291440 [Branchiostoma belcheri]
MALLLNKVHITERRWEMLTGESNARDVKTLTINFGRLKEAASVAYFISKTEETKEKLKAKGMDVDDIDSPVSQAGTTPQKEVGDVQSRRLSFSDSKKHEQKRESIVVEDGYYVGQVYRVDVVDLATTTWPSCRCAEAGGPGPVRRGRRPVYVQACPPWGCHVKLDIFHYLRRFTKGLTTEHHDTFCSKMSCCIFMWDEEDYRQLREAKKVELRKKYGGIKTVWAVQEKHLPCIVDPDGVNLYTITGQLEKGGNLLKVLRWRANAAHTQMYMMGGGGSRWNVNRAREAVQWPATSKTCLYNVRLTLTESTLTELQSNLMIRLHLAGPNQHVRCEQEGCNDILNAVSRGGDVSFQCTHQISVPYAEVAPPEIQLNQEFLTKAGMTKERQEDCGPSKESSSSRAILIVPWDRSSVAINNCSALFLMPAMLSAETPTVRTSWRWARAQEAEPVTGWQLQPVLQFKVCPAGCKCYPVSNTYALTLTIPEHKASLSQEFDSATEEAIVERIRKQWTEAVTGISQVNSSRNILNTWTRKHCRAQREARLWGATGPPANRDEPWNASTGTCATHLEIAALNPKCFALVRDVAEKYGGRGRGHINGQGKKREVREALFEHLKGRSAEDQEMWL